jgi:hypothetical protein
VWNIFTQSNTGEKILLDKISKLIAPSIAIKWPIWQISHEVSITRCENELNSYKNVQDRCQRPSKITMYIVQYILLSTSEAKHLTLNLNLIIGDIAQILWTAKAIQGDWNDPYQICVLIPFTEGTSLRKKESHVLESASNFKDKYILVRKINCANLPFEKILYY